MKYFISVPFTSKVGADGAVESTYRAQIELLLANLRAAGHEVFCALEHADWRFGGLTPPEEELRRDFAEIDKADKVVILLEEKISAGVQLENGYAFAKGKAFETYQIGRPAWSNEAFAKLAGQPIVEVSEVADFIDHVLRRSH